MANTRSIVLSGRELQAILGALILYRHVPFSRTTKRKLTGREIETAGALRDSLTDARNSLVQHPVGQWTPADRRELLSRTTAVRLSDEETMLVDTVLKASLAEHGSDWEADPYLIPWTKRHDLETALNRVAAIATERSC